MTPAYHSLHEYTLRMNRVLEHIDQHLDQPLELGDLAQVAHFSPYHFHRLFSAWVGEPLGVYLRRRRLACGAHLLASRPEASILEIALEVGFGSGEAFSRAFKQHFSVSPSTWRDTEPKRWHRRLDDIRERRLRQLRNPDQTHIPAFDDPDAFIHLKELTMKVTIKELPPVRVAYLRYIGAYGPGIGLFWQQTVIPWMAENGLMGQARYGIGHDDPTSPHPKNAATTPASKSLSTSRGGLPRSSLPCPVASMRSRTTRAKAPISPIPGASCAAIGCPRVVCSPTRGQPSSCIRWVPGTIKPVIWSSISAFRSRRCKP